MRAILALEDGRVFEGESFGATGTVLGEVVFNTAMTGYQEIITDPSYRGQMVTMTYPLIGNYGINPHDTESARPHVSALIIEELSPVESNWRSRQSLEGYFKEWGIPGIQGVDTRALTRHLREQGAMKGCLTSDPAISAEEAVARAKTGCGVTGVDFVKDVTAASPFEWDPAGELSRRWTLLRGDGTGGGTIRDADGENYEPLIPVRYNIVAYDFGIKYNILRQLRQAGFRATVVPAGTSAAEVKGLNPDAVFLSNGPGDPAALGYIHENLRQLIGFKPIFGICLGHQLLGYAVGGKTYKLKFGHHGGNHPVKDLETGKVAITAQNHNFAVDPDTIPSNVKITHVNLNDGTVEGMRHTDAPVFSVQYHPEAAPGPHDANYFFKEFRKLIEDHRKA